MYDLRPTFAEIIIGIYSQGTKFLLNWNQNWIDELVNRFLFLWKSKSNAVHKRKFFQSNFWFLFLQVEELLRNGHKTTKSQLNGSLKDIENQISKLLESIVVNEATPIQLNQFPINDENNIIIKLIIFHRQCERFIYDLLNTLTECNIDRYLKRFRNQLNEIHEIVKFRTAIPISNIFVSSTLQLKNSIYNSPLLSYSKYWKFNFFSGVFCFVVYVYEKINICVDVNSQNLLNWRSIGTNCKIIYTFYHIWI